MATTLIAGGIILFLIALKMVFHGPPEAKSAHAPHKEPFIVPLAIPLVAGPAVLAAVMLYADRQEISLQVLTGAVLLAWIASAAVLLSASLWSRLLGPRGLIACERLMGLILTLISIQMLLDGIKLFLIPCAA
jgi:multiple antibiotic resistance protein